MKSYSSNEIIRLLKEDGWYHVTHPKKDLGKDDLKSIERQSGLKFK